LKQTTNKRVSEKLATTPKNKYRRCGGAELSSNRLGPAQENAGCHFLNLSTLKKMGYRSAACGQLCP